MLIVSSVLHAARHCHVLCSHGFALLSLHTVQSLTSLAPDTHPIVILYRQQCKPCSQDSLFFFFFLSFSTDRFGRMDIIIIIVHCGIKKYIMTSVHYMAGCGVRGKCMG